jgi:hypothetical protein
VPVLTIRKRKIFCGPGDSYMSSRRENMLQGKGQFVLVTMSCCRFRNDADDCHCKHQEDGFSPHKGIAALHLNDKASALIFVQS